MGRKLTEVQEGNIIKRYMELETMIVLAKEYKITRQGIFKLLKRNGIDTSKRHIEISCDACQKVFLRHKFRVRKQKHNFCCPDCYFAYLEAGNGNVYKQSLWGQRIARKKVLEMFDLKEGYVVHHEDRNCLNNDLNNLRVFVCQGDHVRYHRGFDTKPIWAG